jgi:hypothetical protein
MAQTATNLASPDQIAARVLAMSLPDRLRLAAGLVEMGKPEHAEMILDTVTTELQSLRLFGKVLRAK